jgi:hypothetical protein
MTADDTLREAVKSHLGHAAWLSVVAWAGQRRAHNDEVLRYQNTTERLADFQRGQASIFTEILSLHEKLTNPEPSHD